MPESRASLKRLLGDIERELKKLSLWESIQPSSDDLYSQLPFAMDRLNFSQWIQWVLLPKLVACIESQMTLPNASGIASMAEEVYKNEAAKKKLLTLLKDLDICLAHQPLC